MHVSKQRLADRRDQSRPRNETLVGGYGSLVRDRPRGSYRWNVKRPPLRQVEFIRIKTPAGPRADYSLEIRKLVANRNGPDPGPKRAHSRSWAPDFAYFMPPIANDTGTLSTQY